MGDGASRARAGWALWIATIVCAPIVWTPLAVSNEGWWPTAAGTLLVPILPTVALLLTTRRPSNPVGWLLASAGWWFCSGAAASQLAWFGHRHDWADGTVGALLVVASLAFVGISLLPLAVILFPDGRPPSRRWRPLVRANLVGVSLAAVGSLFAPPTLDGDGFTVANPLHVAALRVPATVAAVAGLALIAASTVGAAAAVVVRWRRALGDERAQLKWPALIGAIALAVGLLSTLSQVGANGFVVAAVLLYGGLPAAVAAAIFKYRLYDIDLLINRTIVYAVVTVVLAGVYLAFVTAATLLLGEATETAAGLVAAAIIAIAFAPVRNWVQKTVSRRLFGDRLQPHHALERLGQGIYETTRADELLPTIVTAISTALRVPYVAVVTAGADGEPREASVGSPRGPIVEQTLMWQSAPVGTLRVSGRSPREPLSTLDVAVVAQLSVHVGVAVHAATLADEVQRSRSRLVAATEDERRRLRRDLHDELGPALTAIGFGLDTAANLLSSDGDQDEVVVALLGRLRAHADDALAQIRRVAYALRPPALDDFGLAGALAAQAESLGRDGFDVIVDADGPVDDLPAAVEVAAYRIGVEAMTNAARHSGARHCRVCLHVNDILSLEVRDDGVGRSSTSTAGVGLRSMAERAAELGGRIDITPGAPSGVVVRAILPLDQPGARP